MSHSFIIEIRINPLYNEYLPHRVWVPLMTALLPLISIVCDPNLCSPSGSPAPAMASVTRTIPLGSTLMDRNYSSTLQFCIFHFEKVFLFLHLNWLAYKKIYLFLQYTFVILLETNLNGLRKAWEREGRKKETDRK